MKSLVSLLSVVWLVAASGSVAPSPDTNTREHLISGYTAVMKAWDKDGDGRLSRAEVAMMVDELFRRIAQHSIDAKTIPQLDKQRQELLAFYASQDTDNDGYLTLNELLKGPLANFDCMDENRGGKVSERELMSAMEGRCPSVDLDGHAQEP